MQQTAVLTPAALSALIRSRALEMGFDRVGIAPVHPSAHGDAYARWVALGMHGEMGYLSREDAVAKRQDPAVLVPGAPLPSHVHTNRWPYAPITSILPSPLTSPITGGRR